MQYPINSVPHIPAAITMAAVEAIVILGCIYIYSYCTSTLPVVTCMGYVTNNRGFRITKIELLNTQMS
jgi:predicted aconitase with swiveling domain